MCVCATWMSVKIVIKAFRPTCMCRNMRSSNACRFSLLSHSLFVPEKSQSSSLLYIALSWTHRHCVHTQVSLLRNNRTFVFVVVHTSSYISVFVFSCWGSGQLPFGVGRPQAQERFIYIGLHATCSSGRLSRANFWDWELIVVGKRCLCDWKIHSMTSPFSM